MYMSVLQPEMEGEIESTFLLQKCVQGNNGEKPRVSPWGSPSHIALDLISTHDCWYMSEMQLGRLSGRTFWGRENVGT